MGRNEVYYANHGRALTFPWSLYHKPLIHSLSHFLKNIPERSGKRLLVVGPGDLPELKEMIDYGFKISVLDIDGRVLEDLKKKYGHVLEGFYLVNENFAGYPDENQFDAIYAKEVIEHFPEPALFLKQVKKILKSGGKVWMSTPNYGFFLLPFLESTVLELIARLSGFSRKHIHPSRFSSQSLNEAFKSSGFQIDSEGVTFAKLALWICATKPS